MIELQVVSLIVGVLFGAGAATLYLKLPKKRKGKQAGLIGPRSSSEGQK